jgi:hypothetical protein
MHVVAQLIGYPRIGPNRELKWALERMWSGRLSAAAFAERVDEFRRAHLAEQREAVGSDPPFSLMPTPPIPNDSSARSHSPRPCRPPCG